MKTDTPEKLLEALTVEGANIETYKSQLGFSAAEIDESGQDRANLEAALDNVDIAGADSKSVTKVKNLVYAGDSSETVEPYPAFAITVLPFPLVKAGALSRYSNRRGRAKLAAGYTPQIGIAMGYVDIPPGAISPAELSAAAKLKDAGNYQFEAEFKKQGLSGMAFQWRVKGTEKWSSSVNALQSPVLISTNEPAEEGAAVQIEVRSRLLQGNTQVGNWSPIYVLTVTA